MINILRLTVQSKRQIRVLHTGTGYPLNPQGPTSYCLGDKPLLVRVTLGEPVIGALACILIYLADSMVVVDWRYAGDQAFVAGLDSKSPFLLEVFECLDPGVVCCTDVFDADIVSQEEGVFLDVFGNQV